MGLPGTDGEGAAQPAVRALAWAAHRALTTALAPTPAPSGDDAGRILDDDAIVVAVYGAGEGPVGSTGTSAPSTGCTTGRTSMNVLADVFFAVAATWLLVALLYAAVVLLFLRVRARGELDRLYEADFGRVYLCGRRRHPRCYLSMGWLLRRYVRHIHEQRAEGRAGLDPARSRLMTRAERRAAMDALLAPKDSATVTVASDDAIETAERPVSGGGSDDRCRDGKGDEDGGADSAVVCSICLGEYSADDELRGARACGHAFHRDCILDWLQRQHHTECPCCRAPMVAEEDVWRVVQRMRREAKGEQAKARKQLRKNSTTSASSYGLSSGGSFDCELPLPIDVGAVPAPVEGVVDLEAPPQCLVADDSLSGDESTTGPDAIQVSGA